MLQRIQHCFFFIRSIDTKRQRISLPDRIQSVLVQIHACISIHHRYTPELVHSDVVYDTIWMYDIDDAVALLQAFTSFVRETFAANLEKHICLKHSVSDRCTRELKSDVELSPSPSSSAPS